MKKFLIIAAILLATVAQAQTEKYVSAIRSKLIAVDTTRSVEGWVSLSASFARIGEAEKTQWLPFYYAALTKVNSGYFISKGKMGGLATVLDPIADEAEALITKAEALSPDNSEIYIVRKMIATLRLMADPMSRYMQYGPEAAGALAKARQLDPSNPRVYYLEGQDKLFTPEQFGGSRSEGKKLLELALQKFDQFKPASDIAPQWGRGSTEYFISQAGK